jgi:CheY-like chemotaxis protein
MIKPGKHVYGVLVADDSEDDRFILREAFRHVARLKIVGEVGDGAQAISYFRGRNGFGSRRKHPLPDVLLLDLKMPGCDGFEVLEWLRHQPRDGLAVVVLTNSLHSEDVKRALDLGADLFQVKPRPGQELEAFVLALEDYVLRSAAPPNLPAPHRRLTSPATFA